MTHLEVFVARTNGQRRVEKTFRDDPKGREQCDKVSFALMESSKVVYVSVKHTDRIAGYEGK